jgi:hypothetical protein
MVYIPTELVLEILVRLPWTSLRRLRLVCRIWRDLVHDRTTEMKQCRDAVPLVVTTESLYVLDGQGSSSSKASTPRELWPGSTAACNIYKNMEVVGACNGVLCLCDDARPGGAITLLNPATGDVLALPPIPCAGLASQHASPWPELASGVQLRLPPRDGAVQGRARPLLLQDQGDAPCVHVGGCILEGGSGA